MEGLRITAKEQTNCLDKVHKVGRAEDNSKEQTNCLDKVHKVGRVENNR